MKLGGARNYKRNLPLLLLVTLIGVACRHPKHFASAIKMADVSTANQLVSGFYELSMNEWRWTTREFSVDLGVPPQASGKQADLTVQLYLPDDEMKKLGPMTLTAYASDYELESVTFTKPGSHEYRSELPFGVLCTNILPVSFVLDKALPPTKKDSRELGAVVSSIALHIE